MNLSNKLPDRLAQMTCDRVHVHFLPLPTMVAYLFQPCRHGLNPSGKRCKLYNSLFDYVIATAILSLFQNYIVKLNGCVIFRNA